MTVRHSIARFTATAALVLAAGLGAPAAPAQAADDPVVAVVNGQEIHRSEIEEARTRLPDRLKSVPPGALYPLLVNSLVDTRLVAAEAREEGLQDDPAVKRQLARLENQVLERAFLRQYLNTRITEDVLRARYDKMLEQKGGREEVRARHILVETEARAEELIEELNDGADFETLAKEHSTGPSAARGGDLGYFGEEEMVPAFAKAAFAMEAGSVSDEPVQTQFGWHVIKVEDRREAEPPTFEEAKGDLRAELSQELIGTFVKDLRAEADIQLFKPDGTPIDMDAAREAAE